MPNPMTLAEAKTVDLDVGEDAVATAEAEAAEAAQLVAALEKAAIEGKDKPKNAAAATEAKQLHEFAVKRAARTRDLADKARAARRLLDLEQVGKTVEKIHADAARPDAGMVAALQQIASASASLRQVVGAHNDRVSEAITRAKQLDAEPPAPNGPRPSSAYVAARARQVSSGFTTVQMVDSTTVTDAIGLAVKGDHEAAVRKLHAARREEPPKRADRYFLGPNGRVHPIDDGTPTAEQMDRQAANRSGRFLADDEVAAYLDGRFHGFQAQA